MAQGDGAQVPVEGGQGQGEGGEEGQGQEAGGDEVREVGARQGAQGPQQGRAPGGAAGHLQLLGEDWI